MEVTTMINQNVKSPVRTGANFSAVDLGPLSQLDSYKLEVPELKREVRGKLFINELLSLTGMELSVNKFPGGASMPFYHAHKENEEAYIFVGGTGEMQIDGEIIPIKEGTIVRVKPGGVRTWRNTSNVPLYFICVQARENSLNSNGISDGLKVDRAVTWPE
jgi:mannose-6-phosphate isomerase-like protein (cupin superfamily)